MCRRLTYLTALVWLLVVATDAGIAAEPGLVGWWKLDGDALDSSGAGNHGTLQGDPQSVAGKIGDALDFDGDDNVNVPGVQLPTGAFTITLWFNPAAALGSSSSRQDLLYWQVGNGRPHVTFNRSGTGEIGLWPNVGGDLEGPLTTTRSWAAGTWYHIAATFDGTDFKIYVNGNLENAVNHPGTHADASDLLIGSRTSQRNYFQGAIDDVRLFNRALIEKEIRAVMIGVPPGAASEPSPENEATDVPRDVVLSWTPGEFAPAANGHRVYLSESFSDVNDGIGGVTLSDSSYRPERLNMGATYYWRVDEVNAPPDSTVHRGVIWSFTIEPVGYPIDGAKITATASSAGQANLGPENTINGSGLDENDLHSTTATDMWLSGNELLGAWIQYEFDKVYKLHEMWVWNSNQVFEDLFGFGMKGVTVEYSTDGTDWTALADVPEFARASGTDGYAHDTTVNFSGAVARYVRLTGTSNWGGVLPQYGLSEVRFFYIPLTAREPLPPSGAADVDPDATLAWRAGREAATHNVYLSTDEQAVIDGSVPAVSVADASHSSALGLGSTYYWRIDEVNEAETPATWQGDVWSFSTSQYLLVDGFEDYNDYPPHEIYATWLDGYEDPANGSQVGYLTPPTIETMTVHGGDQSMPLLYSNAGGATYSEAARTFAAPQDWTKYGIQTLTLYFHGAPGNTGQLYVTVNGVKVAYPGDPIDLTRPRWKRWNIDLASLGVNLTSVTTLALGIDGNGAGGTLYIDDIGLFPAVPEQASVEVWIEAEAADSITQPMEIYPAAGIDPVADAGGLGEPSGGYYIGTVSGVPDNNNDPGTQDIATYSFTVPAGTYAIWGRVSNVSNDSLWVHIPDAQYDVPVHSSGWIRWNSIEPETADWHWVRVHSDDADGAVVGVTLTAGEHTILWAHRESQNFLDAFVITNDLD